jgi:hypothetical protein
MVRQGRMAEQDPSLPVVPIERGGRFVFASGNLTLEIDPEVGARVTAFALAGKNLLIGPDVDPHNYGSTFWTSPQSDWGWPPIAEIDNFAYAARVEGERLVLTGPISERLGISVTKVFALDGATGCAQIEYVVHNRGRAPTMLAPWEVSRVSIDGLTFFPTGDGEYDCGVVRLRTEDAAGMTWFEYDAAKIAADSKFFADGKRGLLFHVTHDRLAFIKRFSDTPAADRAPNQGEIEIYANAAQTYVELENQGPYRAIGPGESMRYRVDWFLRGLPDGIEAKMGDSALIEFVESVVR